LLATLLATLLISMTKVMLITDTKQYLELPVPKHKWHRAWGKIFMSLAAPYKMKCLYAIWDEHYA